MEMGQRVRPLALLICIGGVVLWAYNTYYGIPRTAGAGTLLQRRDGRATLEVYPNSPARKAGLQTGDAVDLDPATPADRWMYGHLVGYGRAPLGHHVSYFVRTRTTDRHVDVVINKSRELSARGALTGLGVLEWLFRFSVPWMLLSAAFIFWRAQGRRAYMLGFLLLCWGLGNQLWQAVLWTPWLTLDVAADVVDKALDSVQLVLIMLYALSFGAVSMWRRVVAAVVIAGAAVNFAWSAFLDVTIVSTPDAFLHAPHWTLLWPALLMVCGIVLIATIQVAGRERDVFIWSALPIAAVCLLQGTGTSVYAHGDSPLRTAANVGVEIGFLLLPLGLTYAIFARHVLDVNFILNRAAVFSGVSLVVVGLFVLVEWLISRWLDDIGHAESLAINGGLAIALGMSIRFVHARVEHVLDNVFFRKRHEDEKAIRTLAREAPYFTDSQTLVTRTIAVLQNHANASSVEFVDGQGDDPAIVAMRATHERVDLSAIDGTSLAGEWAYPLVAGGAVRGAIILGPKRSGESYAPDESDAIMQLAGSVANALEHGQNRDDERLTRIESLLERLVSRATS